MPNIAAALFATKEKPHGLEHQLLAHAILFEGSKPYWEIQIGGRLFRFIAHPDFLLEDGLWQLNTYCHIPASEYKHDQHDNIPISLEEEMGEKICHEMRSDIAQILSNQTIHFKLIRWPGACLPELDIMMKKLQAAGVNITAMV